MAKKKKDDERQWKHTCKFLRAVSFQHTEKCSYCGMSRKEAEDKQARRRGADEDDDVES